MIGGCCSFEDVAERHFDSRKAAKELAHYRKRGPGDTTRMLRDGIRGACGVGGGVLDIGAGIGALTFELLHIGMTHAVAVDASPAYLATAREEARRRGLQDAARFIHGDFLRVVVELAPAAVVTLDRVVCCYPWYHQLLQESVRLAERCFALSYPRARWYVRAAIALENGQRRLASNPFRTYIHDPEAMAHVIREAGFELASRHETWTWSVDVYAKQEWKGSL